MGERKLSYLRHFSPEFGCEAQSGINHAAYFLETFFKYTSVYKNIKEYKKIMWLFTERYDMMKITKLNKK